MFKEFSNKNEVSCISYQNDSKGCQHMDVSRARAVKAKRIGISPGWKILTSILDNKRFFWAGEREDNSFALR